MTAILAAASTFMFAAPEAAVADSRACRQLEAELASGQSGRSPAPLRDYAVAIAKQRDHLRHARNESRRSGCAFSLFGQGPAKCDAIQARIGKMEEYLNALERGRAELVRGPDRSRATIVAALEANGCLGEDGRAAGSVPDRGGGPFDQLFNGGLRTLSGLEGGEAAGNDPEESVAGGRRTLRPDGVLGPDFFADEQPKEFRTLCVRTCDGYVFPMSPASSRGDFARDRQNCEAACPGAEVQVYYHSREGEESEDMVSAVADIPYSDLPAAWLYKQAGARPQGCACSRPRSNFEVIAGNPQGAAKQPDPAAQLPAAEHTPSQMERSSGFGRNKVRVVGPVFLPDPEESLDLRAPARTEGR